MKAVSKIKKLEKKIIICEIGDSLEIISEHKYSYKDGVFFIVKTNKDLRFTIEEKDIEIEYEFTLD